jgi:O-antigen/teichoic acid export membrane protein
MSTVISDPASAQQPQPLPQATLARPEPSLRVNFGWTFSSSAFYAACQWGMLSVLAKAGSTTIVGEFALGLAITAPVFMFTNLQLRAVKATDARSDFEFADYFTLRVLASLAGLLLVAAIARLLPYDRDIRMVVLMVGVSKFVESLSDVVAGLLQKHERLDQVAISMFIRGTLSIAAFAVIFLRTHSLVAAVTALVVAWTAVFILYDVGRAAAVLNRGERFFRLSAGELRRLFALSVPLGVVNTLISLNLNIPRYILIQHRGTAELGVFAAISYLVIAVHLVAHALGQSASARLSRLFAAGDVPSFGRMVYKLVALGGLLLAVGLLIANFFGRPLLRITYGPEYAQHIDLLILIVIAGGFAAVGFFFMYGLTAARSFRVQAPIKTLATLITVGLCWTLIPRFGSIGAATALLASEGVFCVAMFFGLRQRLSKV